MEGKISHHPPCHVHTPKLSVADAEGLVGPAGHRDLVEGPLPLPELVLRGRPPLGSAELLQVSRWVRGKTLGHRGGGARCSCKGCGGHLLPYWGANHLRCWDRGHSYTVAVGGGSRQTWWSCEMLRAMNLRCWCHVVLGSGGLVCIWPRGALVGRPHLGGMLRHYRGCVPGEGALGEQ